eukprot:2902203-Pyramimonas_sp.AAC.1
MESVAFPHQKSIGRPGVSGRVSRGRFPVDWPPLQALCRAGAGPEGGVQIGLSRARPSTGGKFKH